MSTALSHVGEVHGIYKLIDVLHEKDKDGHYIYVGQCTCCGEIRKTHYGNFVMANETHKCSHKNIRWETNNLRLHQTFRAMVSRCYNTSDKSYKYYGGKGIKICDEWMKNPTLFESWALSNGYEKELTINRIDSSKDYCPENCEWVTMEYNAKYKSTTRIIEVDGVSHTGRDWSAILNIGTNIINKYVSKYGVDNVAEFIRRMLKDDSLKQKASKQNGYYELYMGVERQKVNRHHNSNETSHM